MDEKTGKGSEFIDQRIFESFDPSIKKKHLNSILLKLLP
jgi:hypothetical protein